MARAPREHTAADGTVTYRVRFRQGGTETSQTFRLKKDATEFAAILSGGGVTDALAWLKAREKSAATITFGQFFEQYVSQLTGVTQRTRADYLAIRRRYLTRWDDLPIPLLTRVHVTTLVNDLEREGKSPKTIQNVMHMLSSCMNLAIDEDHIAKNPCRRVRLPKDALGSHEITFLTHEEFGALVTALPEHYRPFVVFLAGTGLRWSEATAIQSRHVDLTNGTVAVRQAWKRIPGGVELGPPKSPKANRTVNAATMALVAARPLLGKPSDFVFQSPTGNVIHHSNFYNRIWVPSCKRAELDPRPTIHTLRHTHASWLISDGVSLEAIQDQLGHESIETTRKNYARLLPAVGVAVGRSASAGMDRALPDGFEALPALETRSGSDQPAHP